MPYIKQEYRTKLDPYIEDLADEIKSIAEHEDSPTAFAGILNYTCTRLAVKIMPEKRYWVIALITGVFKNIADEFYRRVAGPYEDQQKDRHGDVYEP